MESLGYIDRLLIKLGVATLESTIVSSINALGVLPKSGFDGNFKRLVNTKDIYNIVKKNAFSALDYIEMGERGNRICVMDILYQCATSDVREDIVRDMGTSCLPGVTAQQLDVPLCSSGRQIQYAGYRLAICVTIVSIVFEQYGISFQHDFYSLPCISTGDPVELATRLIVEKSRQYESIVFVLGLLRKLDSDPLVQAFVGALEAMQAIADPIHQRAFVADNNDILFLLTLTSAENLANIRDHGLQPRNKHAGKGGFGSRTFHSNPGIYLNLITRGNIGDGEFPYTTGGPRLVLSKTLLNRRDFTINTVDNNGVIGHRTYTPDTLQDLPLDSPFMEVVFQHDIPFEYVAKVWVLDEDRVARIAEILPSVPVLFKPKMDPNEPPVVKEVVDPITDADNVANYCFVHENSSNYKNTIAVKQLARNCNVPEDVITGAKSRGMLTKLVLEQYLAPYYMSKHTFPSNPFIEYVPPFLKDDTFINFEYRIQNSGLIQDVFVVLDTTQVTEMLHTGFLSSVQDAIYIDNRYSYYVKEVRDHFYVAFSPRVLLEHPFHVEFVQEKAFFGEPVVWNLIGSYTKDQLLDYYMHEGKKFSNQLTEMDINYMSSDFDQLRTLIKFDDEAFNLAPYVLGSQTTNMSRHGEDMLLLAQILTQV